LYTGIRLYFEAALLIAMLGFVGTVVMAKFLLRKEAFR
jgi:multicomponent K+:H+ antiporter subunit F